MDAAVEVDAEDIGALDAEAGLSFDGGSLSRNLRLGTRARPLRRSLGSFMPSSSRALLDMPTLFWTLGGRPRGLGGAGGATFCRLGEGTASTSSVRCRFNGRCSAADAERDVEAALDNLWFRAARFFCDKNEGVLLLWSRGVVVKAGAPSEGKRSGQRTA